MNCECCNKVIQPRETAHGFRHGTADGDTDLFLPARESAWTVICSACGEKVYRVIYSQLCNTSINPTIFKTFMQYG
jgi:predicted RNA-binding Zn-ribbon protein involved in translation (DUF1610 family)